MKLRPLDDNGKWTILAFMLQGSRTRTRSFDREAAASKSLAASCDRNMSGQLASSSEEVESMQTVSNRQQRAPQATTKRHKRFAFNSASGGLIIFLGSLLFFVWLVQEMEGFNLDTIFLGIYCSIVLAFSIESIMLGILPHSR